MIKLYKNWSLAHKDSPDVWLLFDWIKRWRLLYNLSRVNVVELSKAPSLMALINLITVTFWTSFIRPK